MISLDRAGEEALAAWKQDVDLGDHVGVTGEVISSRSGELSVLADSFAITAKALRPLPDKHKGLTDPESRVRQRYVDLMTNPAARRMALRSEPRSPGRCARNCTPAATWRPRRRCCRRCTAVRTPGRSRPISTPSTWTCTCGSRWSSTSSGWWSAASSGSTRSAGSSGTRAPTPPTIPSSPCSRSTRPTATTTRWRR